jgi:hypothetical protein
MELNNDEAVVIKEDSDRIVWRGAREHAHRVAMDMAKLKVGVRYNVVQLNVIGTYYHNPKLYFRPDAEPDNIVVFPARPAQAL